MYCRTISATYGASMSYCKACLLAVSGAALASSSASASMYSSVRMR